MLVRMRGVWIKVHPFKVLISVICTIPQLCLPEAPFSKSKKSRRGTQKCKSFFWQRLFQLGWNRRCAWNLWKVHFWCAREDLSYPAFLRTKALQKRPSMENSNSHWLFSTHGSSLFKQTKSKTGHKGRLLIWCAREDLNLHVRRH